MKKDGRIDLHMHVNGKPEDVAAFVNSIGAQPLDLQLGEPIDKAKEALSDVHKRLNDAIKGDSQEPDEYLSKFVSQVLRGYRARHGGFLFEYK